MGRPKQALPYRGSTLAATVTRTLLDAGVAGLVVVTRTSLINALGLVRDRRIRTAVNDDGTSEMIDSIRIGLNSLARGQTPSKVEGPRSNVGGPQRQTLNLGPSTFDLPAMTDGVMVVPADMPTVSVDACRTCIMQFRKSPQPIIIATHSGHRGHPIIFPFSMHADIAKLVGGLNELPRKYPQRVQLVEVDDPGVTRDVDTPADYQDL